MVPLSIVECGMVTGVGLTAASSCAAMRVGITGFTETRFMFNGEWLVGCPVPLATRSRGRDNLLQMLTPALAECFDAARPAPPSEIPIFLGVAETDRPGRLSELNSSLLSDAASRMGFRLHRESTVIEGGRTGGVDGLEEAAKILARGHRWCIVAGVDSLLVAETLTYLNNRRRLLTAANSDGFIPGEAAAAILLTVDTPPAGSWIVCRGIGRATEVATIDSGEPLRGEGMAQAFRAAVTAASCTWGDVDYQLAGISGDQYGFKETALAVARTVRPVKHGFDLWHPSDAIGEVGSAIVPCMLGVSLIAARKRYAPGPGVLCHAGDDQGRRTAVVLRAETRGS